MRKLLIFRFQCAFINFWRRHPAIVAPFSALIFVGAALVPFLCSLVFLSGIDPWLLRAVCIFAISAPGGALLAWALFRWVPMIPQDEQWALVRMLAPGCVPTDRRICMLERHLILRTQGDANKAWESQQALQISTNKAVGQVRVRRL